MTKRREPITSGTTPCALGIILRRFNQPHVVAYLLAGAFLGPSGLGFVDDREVIVRLGVVLKLLRDRNETDETVGSDIVGILMVQDIAIVPMLMTVNLLGGESPPLTTVSTQTLGGIFVVLLFGFSRAAPDDSVAVWALATLRP